MKNILETIVTALTLSASGCASSNPNVSINHSAAAVADGKYDSVDDFVNPEDPPKLKDTSYMVISESEYKGPDGKQTTMHSLGTAVIYKDIGSKTYLATANHVVENEKALYDFFGNKYELSSEKFYLLEDEQVGRMHELLRKLSLTKQGEKMYIKDAEGNKKESLTHFVKTSDELAIILKVLKPKSVKTVAQNPTLDLAVISVPKLKHQPSVYSIGNSKELQTQNLVYVVGWPRGLVETVSRGHITSSDDSRLSGNHTANFIFDASISPGNSGGGIFAVRDGKLELVGITSALYLGANDLYIGVKIDPLSEVFKEKSLQCASGWKCNLSLPYELKL